MKRILILIGVTSALLVLFTVISVMETGLGRGDGRSMDEILGVPSVKALPEDVARLSKAAVMQLFYAADTPGFADMKGEYRAELVSVGIAAPVSEYYGHHLMGPGHWEGKAFFPFQKDKGWGYNLFTVKKGEAFAITRTMKMDTSVGKSRYDDKDSFHLVYKAYNKGRNNSMRDEIRKINDKLFLGLGYVSWNLDKWNPSFFVLYGEAEDWVGLDDD